MIANQNSWYRVPEVWLILMLLASTMVGSLALVATAYRHRDQLPTPPPISLASPLPPSAAPHPADAATP
jgi:hypothetical protein